MTGKISAIVTISFTCLQLDAEATGTSVDQAEGTPVDVAPDVADSSDQSSDNGIFHEGKFRSSGAAYIFMTYVCVSCYTE